MAKVHSWEIVTASAEQTMALGLALGQLLPLGSLVLLTGELGAGKTALTQGIARGLGVSAEVPITSPTYTLMNSYSARLPLYHFDLYRLSGADELQDLGFEEYFHGSGVAVVEWAERCPELSGEALSINIDYASETTRRIKVACSGANEYYIGILNSLSRFELNPE